MLRIEIRCDRCLFEFPKSTVIKSKKSLDLDNSNKHLSQRIFILNIFYQTKDGFWYLFSTPNQNTKTNFKLKENQPLKL
jgi:hypothetical protein